MTDFTEERAGGEAGSQAACSEQRGKGPKTNGLRQLFSAASTKTGVKKSLASWAGACFIFFWKALLR